MLWQVDNIWRKDSHSQFFCLMKSGNKGKLHVLDKPFVTMFRLLVASNKNEAVLNIFSIRILDFLLEY